MRILIISAEVWRHDSNGGNVLSNIFSASNAEFAQIYCNPGTPNNTLCKLYYQMTDSMIIENLLRRKKIGNAINFTEYPTSLKEDCNVEQANKNFYKFFHKFSFEIFHVIKDILWLLSNWDNDNLTNFVKTFNPDIVFAPCYGSHFMLKLDRYICSLTDIPVISYISDDHYTLDQFRISPIFWINRLVLRHGIRVTFPKYDLIYTMTDEQKDIYETKLNCKMKVLKKAGNFKEERIRKSINNPIRLIYAGGIYCGRDKTLVELVKSIKKINSSKMHFILDIYTNNVTSKKNLNILNDKINSFMHSTISKEELEKKYSESDIALHVESFKLKYKKMTKLSFSTKIIDCLESGAAVMAIADKEQAGLHYISNNNLGFCITNKKDIDTVLQSIIDNPELIKQYSECAYKFGKENHDKNKILKEFETDFVKLSKKSNQI